MEELKLIDAGPEGSVLFELLIDEKYSNLNGMLDSVDRFVVANTFQM
jgi:hypothetical protein